MHSEFQWLTKTRTSLGIAGQYDTDAFHDAIDKISRAAEKASVDGRKVFVGLGGLEGRPDLLEAFTKRYSNIRYVSLVTTFDSIITNILRLNLISFTMAGRDLSILVAGMSKQLESIRDISSRI